MKIEILNMNTNYRIFTSFLLFILLPFLLSSQIVINEYSAANLESFQDEFDRAEDWIELYNASSSDLDLGGWHLSDKPDNPTKWIIPNGTIIPANGHLLFICSARDGVFSGQCHTNFRLTQTEDDEFIVLSNTIGQIIEQHQLFPTLVEHSHSREFDGSAEWLICTQPTFGTSNNGSQTKLGYTATPEIQNEAGFYQDSVLVSIENVEENSVLRYTINGDEPTSNSPEYTAPFTVYNTTVVKAKSFSNNPDILPGKIDFHTFFINEDQCCPK